MLKITRTKGTKTTTKKKCCSINKGEKVSLLTVNEKQKADVFILHRLR